MIKVRGLQTTAGEYGILRRGSIVEVRKSVATHLQKEGLAEIVGEDDGNDSQSVSVAGVRIKDAEGNDFTGGFNSQPKQHIIIKNEDPQPQGFEQGKVEVKKEPKAEQEDQAKVQPEHEKKAEPKETAKNKK